MKKLLSLILICIFVFSGAVLAQDVENTLSYGGTLEGEISDREFEIEYSFESTEADIIIIQVIPEDAFSGFSQPTVILLDGDFDILETVDAGLSAATLIYEIPEDGTYNIIVTRQDGRSGESTGTYTLSLDVVQFLSTNEVIETTSFSSQPTYFAIRASNPTDLRYIKLSGDFYPALTLNVLDEELFSDDNLSSIIELGGDALEQATIRIPQEDKLFIVRIGEGLFDFNFSEKKASVSLEIISVE